MAGNGWSATVRRHYTEPPVGLRPHSSLGVERRGEANSGGHAAGALAVGELSSVKTVPLLVGR